MIPSDTVVKPIGAGGYLAALIGMFAFAAFLAVTLLGLHNPLRQRHPIRTVLCLLWLSVLASYVLMDRNALTVPELASADRLLMQLAVITGVALIAAEFLGSLHDVRRVLRVLCWGGAFCGVVAALQFSISLDISPYLRELPGFSLNLDNVGIADPERTEPGHRDGRLPDRARSRGRDAAATRDLPRDLRHRPKCAAAVGAGGTDRARDPGVGVPLGGPLGRRGVGGAGGADAGAPAAGRNLRFAVLAWPPSS